MLQNVQNDALRWYSDGRFSREQSEDRMIKPTVYTVGVYLPWWPGDSRYTGYKTESVNYIYFTLLLAKAGGYI